MPLDPSRVLRELLTDMAASRVTLRLDVAGMNFPVVAEAVDGVAPLSGLHSLDQRNLATVRYLFRTHDVLVQDDCQGADPPPPAALVDAYGVKAQMLAPLLYSGTVLGWVSVHDCTKARSWTRADVGLLRAAVAEISEALLGPTGEGIEER
jgi:maleate isomerase